MYYTDDQFKGNVPKYEVSFYTEEKNNSLRTVNCIVNSASIELRRYMKKLATPQKKINSIEPTLNKPLPGRLYWVSLEFLSFIPSQDCYINN